MIECVNKDIINKAIENPELLVQMNADDLEKISAQFPYFSAAQILLSKNYKQNNDYRFADQVGHAALYTGNRNTLYHWLKESEMAKSTAAVRPDEIVVTPSLVVEEKLAILEDVIENKPSFTPQLLENFDTGKTEIVEVDSSFTADVKGLVNFILNDGDETEKENESIALKLLHEEEPDAALKVDKASSPNLQASDLDDMQREILIEAVHSSIELEVAQDMLTEDELVSEELDAEDENPFTSITADSYADWVFKRSKQIHFAENDRNHTDDSSLNPTLGDWKHLSDEELQAKPEAEQELNNEELAVRPEPVKRMIAVDFAQQQRDLIDKFIRTEPKITRNKSVDYTPGNMAKESLEEDLSFVTETMAVLFAKQGRLDKARKAFKKLMEQHPEKSVYFAAQLKNLDKLKKP